MTNEFARRATDKAKMIADMDQDVNGNHVNAPYTILVDDIRLKVHVRIRVNEECDGDNAPVRRIEEKYLQIVQPETHIANVPITLLRKRKGEVKVTPFLNAETV